MQTVATLLILFLLFASTSGPAWAGTRANARVTTNTTGVQLGATTPGRPAEATPVGDRDQVAAHDASARSVTCSYTPVASPNVGVTFAATCSNPLVVSIPFDPAGNARFIVPVPGDPSAPSSTVPATGGPLVTPEVLAAQAARFLPLPAPIIRTNPAADLDQLVNLETWLWVDQVSWGRRTAIAAVPGLAVTVVATPTTVTWRPGDGTVQVCRGPGAAYDPGRPPAAQRTACGHTYRRSSAGEPAARYRMTATTTWTIRWSASGAVTASGTLPPLQRSAQTSLRVVQAEALN